MNTVFFRLFITIFLMGIAMCCLVPGEAAETIPSQPENVPSARPVDQSNQTADEMQVLINSLNRRIDKYQNRAAENRDLTTPEAFESSEQWTYQQRVGIDQNADLAEAFNLQVHVDNTGLVTFEGDYVNEDGSHFRYYSPWTPDKSEIKKVGYNLRFSSRYDISGETDDTLANLHNEYVHTLKDYRFSNKRRSGTFEVDPESQRFRFTIQYSSFDNVPDTMILQYYEQDRATGKTKRHAMKYSKSTLAPFSGPSSFNSGDLDSNNPADLANAGSTRSLNDLSSLGRSNTSRFRALSGNRTFVQIPTFLLKDAQLALQALAPQGFKDVLIHSPRRKFLKLQWVDSLVRQSDRFISFNLQVPVSPLKASRRTLTLQVESSSKEVTKLIEDFVKEHKVNFEVVQIIMQALGEFEEAAYQDYLMGLRPYYAKLATLLTPIVEQLGLTMPVTPNMDSSVVTYEEMLWMAEIDQIVEMVFEKEESLTQDPAIGKLILQIRDLQTDFYENTLAHLERDYELRVQDSLIQFLEELEEMIKKKDIAHIRKEGEVIEIILKPSKIQ